MKDSERLCKPITGDRSTRQTAFKRRQRDRYAQRPSLCRWMQLPLLPGLFLPRPGKQVPAAGVTAAPLKWRNRCCGENESWRRWERIKTQRVGDRPDPWFGIAEARPDQNTHRAAAAVSIFVFLLWQRRRRRCRRRRWRRRRRQAGRNMSLLTSCTADSRGLQYSRPVTVTAALKDRWRTTQAGGGVEMDELTNSQWQPGGGAGEATWRALDGRIAINSISRVLHFGTASCELANKLILSHDRRIVRPTPSFPPLFVLPYRPDDVTFWTVIDA